MVPVPLLTATEGSKLSSRVTPWTVDPSVRVTVWTTSLWRRRPLWTRMRTSPWPEPTPPISTRIGTVGQSLLLVMPVSPGLPTGSRRAAGGAGGDRAETTRPAGAARRRVAGAGDSTRGGGGGAG